MSFTNFDDLYQICCDWGKEGLHEEVIRWEVKKLSRDGVTDVRLTRSNPWWEVAVKEIHEERESVPI